MTTRNTKRLMGQKNIVTGLRSSEGFDDRLFLDMHGAEKKIPALFWNTLE